MKLPERVYLAGPMTGIPEHNFPAFMEAARELRRRGIKVYNPADRPFQRRLGMPLEYYLGYELRAVCNAEAVVVLPGWEHSRGTQIETTVAYLLNKPVLVYPTLLPVTIRYDFTFNG